MLNSGYFIVPRSLTTDPRYKSAPLKYQKVLLTLLERIAFADTKQANGSNQVIVKKGQFYTSMQNLVKICNEDVRLSEDLIDKSLIQRAIAYFEKCNFSIHESIHSRSMITITIPEIYSQNKVETDTDTDTASIRHRYTKEEDKEIKKDHLTRIDDDDFFKNIEAIPNVFMSKSDFDECLKIHNGNKENTIAHISQIQSNSKRKSKIVNWPSTLKKWIFVIKKQDLSNVNKQLAYKLETKYDNPNNMWGFSHDTVNGKEGTVFFCRLGQTSKTHFISYSEEDYEKKINEKIKETKMQIAKKEMQGCLK